MTTRTTFVDPSSVPRELVEYRHWVAWKYAERDGKPAKLPVNPRTGRLAEANNPDTWDELQAAICAAAQFKCDGIGYVFAETDPYSGVDLDDCRNPETGEIQPWAWEIIRSLDSYTEVSPSQTGVKIWVSGKLAAGARNRGAYQSGEVEMYSRERYFTVTGQHLEGAPTTIEERQAELLALHARIFAAHNREANGAATLGQNIGAVDPDDAALLDRARNARNGATFVRLWNGDYSDYPSQSEADLALCSILAFWTGKDPARIDVLFRQSGLMREKWDRADYRDRTIEAACENATRSWTSSGVAADATSLQQDGSTGQLQEHEKITQVKRLLLLGADAELFHTPAGDLFASLPVKGHVENWPLKSKQFRQWLLRRYYLETKGAPKNQALQEAIAIFESRANFEGPEYPVFTRLAESNGRIYLDLGNDAWEAVEIDPDGWRVRSDVPVKFRRARGMSSLPDPVRRAGSVNELQRFVNVASEQDWILLAAWLVAAFRPHGPYPILVLHGEQGSAKSTTSRVFRSLLDPNTAPLRVLIREMIPPEQPSRSQRPSRTEWRQPKRNSFHMKV